MKGVKLKDVEEAHAKDLRRQGKYGVNFQKYWLDEEKGTIFCLSDPAQQRGHSKSAWRSPRPSAFGDIRSSGRELGTPLLSFRTRGPLCF